MKGTPKKDNRASKMASARKRVTHALSISRDPISHEYRLFLGVGKGKDLKIAVVAQFTAMDKDAKRRIRSIREAVAGLLAGMPSYKYKRP